jgi:hypothetical protein
MVSKVRGRFTSFAGAIEIADDLLDSSVVVTVDMASVDTRTATHICAARGRRCGRRGEGEGVSLGVEAILQSP